MLLVLYFITALYVLSCKFPESAINLSSAENFDLIIPSIISQR